MNGNRVARTANVAIIDVMRDFTPDDVDRVVRDLRSAFTDFQKRAFTPSAPPAGPQMAPPPDAGGGAPPMDPSMAGGAPPMDPSMAGGAPPMDPSMAGGAPPMDPAAAGGAPPQGGGGPDIQQILSDLAGGVDGMSETMKQQQQAIDQLSSRSMERDDVIEDLQNQIRELQNALNGPQPMPAGEEPQKNPLAPKQ